VLTALAQHNLEARVAEGLPWLVLWYPDMPARRAWRLSRRNDRVVLHWGLQLSLDALARATYDL